MENVQTTERRFPALTKRDSVRLLEKFLRLRQQIENEPFIPEGESVLVILRHK